MNDELESVWEEALLVSFDTLYFSYLEGHIKARISGLWHPEIETEISRLGRRNFKHSTATILGEVTNNPVEKYNPFYRVLDHVSCHGVSRRKWAAVVRA